MTPTEQSKVVSLSVDVFVTLLVICLFGYLSFMFLAPFVTILIWATILTVALYPVYLWLRERLGPLGKYTSLIMALVSLVALLWPTLLTVDSMIDTTGELAGKISRGELTVPTPNESVKEWPIVGKSVFKFWEGAHTNLTSTLAHFADELKGAATKLLSISGGLLVGVLQFAVSIIFACIFMSFAGPLVNQLDRIVKRVGSDRGTQMLDMAGATIRNVSRGVLGVAVLQGILAAVGLFVYGMPFAGVLAAITLMLCIVQAPPLAFIPIIIFAWSQDSGTATVIFTVYMIAVMFLDNVLKPILMARGLSTPMVVILIGVIGGTLGAGMLGLFIGPVILALFYEMVMIWVASIDETPSEEVSAGDEG